MQVPHADAVMMMKLDPDMLGRVVRDAWVKWARTQPNPKPSWLVPYDQLSEPEKEADRQIGMAVEQEVVVKMILKHAIDAILSNTDAIRGLVEAARHITCEHCKYWTRDVPLPGFAFGRCSRRRGRHYPSLQTCKLWRHRE